MITAVVCDGRSYIKGTGGMGRPGRTDSGRVKGVAQLTNRVEGVGVEVKRKSMQTVVSGDRRVRVPGLEVVECELDVGKEAVPKVKREGNMNRCEGGDDVILRRTNIPFGKIRTMIVRRHKLDSYIDSWVGKIRS